METLCSNMSQFTIVLNILLLVRKEGRREGKYWFKRSIAQCMSTMLKSIKPLNIFFFFFSQDDCISFIFLEPIDPNSLYLTLSKFYSLTSLWPLKWIIFFFKITNSSFHLLETMLLNRSSCLVTMGKIVLWLSLFTPSQNNFIFQTQRVSEKFREITKKGPYFPSSLW